MESKEISDWITRYAADRENHLHTDDISCRLFIRELKTVIFACAYLFGTPLRTFV